MKSDKKIEIRVPESFKIMLDAEANRQGMTLSQWVRWVLQKHIPVPELVKHQIGSSKR